MYYVRAFLCAFAVFALSSSTASVSAAAFQERYFTQKLVPIDRLDTRTWQNRYFIDESDYTPGGPIFVYVGGPDFYMTELRMQMSHFFDVGRQQNAVLIATELRFYGESRPTADLSLANLQYTDSRYAVDDVAALIRHLQTEYGTEPVIVHGFGHGGAIAVWLRQRYPELVDGVWAAAATVSARMDFGESLVHIGASIRQVGGQECYDRTEMAFTQMEWLYYGNLHNMIEEKFNICGPFTGARNEGAIFFSTYALAFVQILRTTHTYGIDLYCQYMDEAEDEIGGFASFIQLIVPDCVSLDYDAQVEAVQDVSWDNIHNYVGARQLSYQQCREFGWFSSSSYLNQPFGSRFPVQLFQQMCIDLFGPVFDLSTIMAFVDNTNRIFGGVTPNITNAYFTDGALDPSLTLGVLESNDPTVYVDIIPGFAAGAEIFPIGNLPDPILVTIQETARNHILHWTLERRARKQKDLN